MKRKARGPIANGGPPPWWPGPCPGCARPLDGDGACPPCGLVVSGPTGTEPVRTCPTHGTRTVAPDGWCAMPRGGWHVAAPELQLTPLVAERPEAEPPAARRRRVWREGPVPVPVGDRAANLARLRALAVALFGRSARDGGPPDDEATQAARRAELEAQAAQLLAAERRGASDG